MRLFPVVAAFAAVAACSTKNDSSASIDLTLPTTSTSVAGSFNLVRANGRLLPYDAAITNTETWTLVQDRLILAPAGTWVDTTDYSIHNILDGSTSARGTATAGSWTIANGQINFTMTSGGTSTFVGAVANDVLLVNFNGARYEYRR